MRNLKIILGLIVVALLGLFFYQNKAYFLARQALGINFYVTAYRFPEIANGLFFLGCLVIGMLLAYVASLAGRFEAKRTIGSLNATIATHLATIDSLQNELAAVKRGQVAQPAPETVANADPPAA